MKAPLRLNVNELPWSPWESPSGLAPGLDIDLKTLALNRYPDPSYLALRQAVAARCQLSPDQVTLANGSDELIWLCLSVLLQAGDTLAAHLPTFGEYERMAQLRGAKTVYAPLEADLSTSLPSLLTIARRYGAKMTVICRPNNPTGELLPFKALTDFLDAYEGYVLLDEAYIEFANPGAAVDGSMALIAKYPNLIVLRTFSKAYGLAGLRLGYGLASEAITAKLNSQRPPYNVNAVTEAIGRGVLAENDYYQERIDAVIQERDRVCAALSDMGIDYFPSAANFILITKIPDKALNPELPDKRLEGKAIRQQLALSGLAVRAFEEPWLANCIRFSLGTPSENDAFLKAVSQL